MLDSLKNLLIEVTNQNDSSRWAVLFSLSVFISIILRAVIHLLNFRIRRLAEKTPVIWDQAAVGILERTHGWILFAWVFYFVTRAISQETLLERPFKVMVAFSFVYQMVVWGQYLMQVWKRQVLEKRVAENPSSSAALGLLYRVMQGGFITLVILLGLSNVGVDIRALLAGLGVGGIAVALAAQNILGDLLASLSIVLDKPFVVGDFIVSGEVRGTIESIGIKTTRLRSISGEQIVISNKDLLESRVQNFKRMWERRVVKRLGFVYSTSPNTLAQIPTWIKEIINREEKLRFERCHFIDYGASSLDFELVFYVTDPDYKLYMDIQQRILLDILSKLNNEKVEFAFPTQSLLIEKVPTIST